MNRMLRSSGAPGGHSYELPSLICVGIGVVAGSLLDEEKGRLLQRFKVLCIAGLQIEGNQTDLNEAMLIRCNCCYNLPVKSGTQTQESFRS